MTFKRGFQLNLITFLLAVSFITATPSVSHAMNIYNPANPFWNQSHWVTLKQNIKVFKIRNTNPMTNRYKVGTYTLKKGTHVKLFHSAVNFAWGLDSGKFNTNRTYTFAVNKGENNHAWFKFGIH